MFSDSPGYSSTVSTSLVRQPFYAVGPGACDDPAEQVARVSEDPPSSGPSMKFIHSRRYLNKGETVHLDCDTQCNFMLLSDDDFAAYQLVRQFRYHGGTFKNFPARITVPATGYWNVIIDLAGAKEEIAYNITVVLD
jgi:hypothetical protein